MLYWNDQTNHIFAKAIFLQPLQKLLYSHVPRQRWEFSILWCTFPLYYLVENPASWGGDNFIGQKFTNEEARQCVCCVYCWRRLPYQLKLPSCIIYMAKLFLTFSIKALGTVQVDLPLVYWISWKVFWYFLMFKNSFQCFQYKRN